ncbi:MAG: putative rane transporter protein [Nocardioides sp.]|uniref:sulfite exporter TauE/SafE family protein n=1 Tax=Nocardioides sp. TaxID=35761 RepID=UPI0026073158|nr:sulfite exporter TauE/SafE family protein [Nocardioides sp.]MCW2833705.1 putative rane transporter protein [Nocardioides sp.]
MTYALLAAVVAGALIGLSLGALGGGGSILAVPVLLALGQTATQATTGSLVVVGLTSLAGAMTAYRAGNVLLARGLTFGAVAIAGAVAGAHTSAAVPEAVLLTAFAGLMLVVATLMTVRQLRHHRGAPSGTHADRPQLDDPIITFSPTFMCQCPQALKVVVAATAVGLLTGFLGVGGGFLVVPALALALALPMGYAAGTSLVVITITSTAALATRAGTGIAPDWWLVAALTVTAIACSVAGARLAARTDTARLSAAFTALVLLVAAYTAATAIPALS